MSELVDDWDTLGFGAKIDDGSGTLGIIAGAIIDASGNGIASLPTYDDTLPQITSGYFFYSGNAPAYTEIRFTLAPVLDNNKYIITPRNSHSPKTSANSNEFNTITIESRT
jgi:hypothetical protein